MDTDDTPLRRSKRLMHFRAHQVSNKLNVIGQPIQDYKAIISFAKSTSSTIKKNMVGFNLDNNKMIYGTHSKKCFGCCMNPKAVRSRRPNLKKDTRKTIDECFGKLGISDD